MNEVSEWARVTTVRLMQAVPTGALLAEANRLIDDVKAMPQREAGERMLALVLTLAGVAGDSAAQAAKATGDTFEHYMDELERNLAEIYDDHA